MSDFNDWGAMSPLARTIFLQKYSMDGNETWADTAKRVTTQVFSGVKAKGDLQGEVYHRILQRKFLPGGRYLYASGRPFHQTQNCLLLRAEDSREGWAGLMHKATMSLMTGAGIGAWYGNLRPRDSMIHRTGGFSTGPLALGQMINESGRHIQQGGSRRAAIWMGLPWWHKDVWEFMKSKQWSEDIRALKAKNFNFPAPMDMTNISVGYDDDWFDAMSDPNWHKEFGDGSARWVMDHDDAQMIFKANVAYAMQYGEPGFSIDVGVNAGENLRNACTEITSRDDSDICNIGSVNMARHDNIDDFIATVKVATAFLLAGTVYSDVPYEKVGQVRTQNRRLGLGLLGLHEWLLVRGKQYGPDAELARWLTAYEASNTIAAYKLSQEWSLSPPIKTRAIAPTGTIGIIAETTTGIEPIFAVAQKRRYLKGSEWKFQYQVDPTAKRLIDAGVAPEKIEDAYALSHTPERRIAFQTFMQQYVDQGISSTINLQGWGTPFNNPDRVPALTTLLRDNMSNLRGITMYPDGAISGQPLTVVPYAEAVARAGEELTENYVDVCDLRGGSCGA